MCKWQRFGVCPSIDSWQSLMTLINNLSRVDEGASFDGEANMVGTTARLTTLLRKYKLPATLEIIRPGFGMTELCAGSIYNKTCPSYDVQHNLGRYATATEPGNLESSGESLFREYYDDPEATSEASTEGFWTVTGDRATIDEHGYLHLTGRAAASMVSSLTRTRSRGLAG